MGKHGPCCHCGVTSTPLWRNGPPEKPVLCNACGSRWRTKGSLTNYTPMHARDPLDPEDFKVTKTKSISIKLKEQKPLKKKQSNGLLEINNQRTHHDQNFRKILEEDTSNRSSTGSAVSFSGSCAHLGTTDASDLTGSAQSNVWDSLVPSRKRTCVARPRPSQFEKLTKDLYSIWYQQQSSYLSGSSEEDLLYESETPFGSDEIGHGGVLIRRPNSKTLDEESEASSIPIDNKPYVLNDVYSSTASISMRSENRGTCSSHVGIERLRNSTAEMLQVQAKRDNKPSNDKLQIIRNRDSPLCSTELKDVLNFEVFISNLTHEEQQKLMRFLPFVDVAKEPESLKSMFSSSQFSETCSYFQHLIADGVFDTSFVGANVEECRSLKRLVLLNLTKSKWVERYKELKEAKCKTGGNNVGGKENASRPSFVGFSKLTPLKRICESENTNFREMKGSTRSPKRSIRPGVMSSFPTKLPPQQNTDEFVDNEGICFSPRSLFATPPCRSSMLTSLDFTDDSSDQDLLLEVPCNAPTPEAELLFPPWKQKPNAAPAESVIAVGEESLSDFPVSSISSQQQMHH